MNCRRCKHNKSRDPEKWQCVFDVGISHPLECYLKHLYMKTHLLIEEFIKNSEAYRSSMEEYKKTTKKFQEDIDEGNEWKRGNE